ncbi:sensor domain-containing protein [Mycobacterium sp. CBMA271]|uniref:sensor domain-containing protein n=1 Tax=unclassified Mycobacteroides TaxID=2618759 RepID=UPI0012DE8DAA|nr:MULTISPECIES: sensor domain-containing protein [unclassified Mycobacteroides]MUM19702.1 hypothetical protein [Mycobacteroides sp. CBMA 326]MUM24306.1 sensor domain-containing protein [Mycobacteroides sp. CBMA 271]
MRALAIAAVPAVALVFAPSAQAIGPETVLLKPAAVSKVVGTELPVSRTFDAPTLGYRVSDPGCINFVDIGADEVFNGNGELGEYRGQSSQKSDSDTTYYVRQAVGVFKRPLAAVDPVVAVLFMDNCYGVPLEVTDDQGVHDTWTVSKGESGGKSASWSMTNAAGRTCDVQMRAKREVMFQVMACVPSNGKKIAKALADEMEGVS